MAGRANDRQVGGNHYFFVRVWNERGGEAAGGDPNEPIAWLAPVWTGR